MASNPAKPVAKSLHTVSVIIQVARLHEANGVGSNLIDAGEARTKQVSEAMATLGLAGRPDPYNLAGAALAQLNKESVK